jgi:membrane-associated phospholipid phosphatase
MDGRRARDVAGIAIGAAVFLATAGAARRGVSDTETALFRDVNTLPDRASRFVWPPMQYGTFATVPAVAALAFVRGHRRLAAGVAAAGTGAWVLAKAAKPLVDRGRPGDEGIEVRIRGRDEDGLGFPSGHAAVSAAMTTVLWPELPPALRATTAALAAFVPFARMYVGVHLPLDVLGGSALGLAVGSLVDLVSQRRG